MKPVCQFNRGYGINDEPDAPSPHPPPPPPPSVDDASEDEDDNIEFHSAGIDSNDGVEDEARFHSYDEPQLASKALFFQS